MNNNTNLIPVNRITRAIHLLRGERVILDADIAELYGVPTKRLNESVRRNLGRFPTTSCFSWMRKSGKS